MRLVDRRILRQWEGTGVSNAGRRLVVGMLCCATLAFGSNARAADEYPSRPIRFILPSAPGGAAELVGRQMVTMLRERTGWNAFAESRFCLHPL